MDYQSLLDFENQSLVLESFPSPVAESLSDDEINAKYLKGEIRIVTEQARYPLNTIKSMVDSNDYILNPDFQRRHRWDIVKQSRLIESFIINIPISPIFLYEKDFSVYEVMDGLQRLTAIKEFYEDKYALAGLEKWPELNGRKYSELPEQIRKGIDRRYLSSIILLKETAKSEEEANSLKQIVFGRINSGGAKLEDQESRNAQFPSNFNQMIIQLARNYYFCEIFDIPQPDAQEDLQNDIISEELKNNKKFASMKDVEIVLRFFAMRVIHLWTEGTLASFLDRYMHAMDSASSDVLNDCIHLFEDTIALAYEIYGDNVFCVWKKNVNTSEYKWSKKPTMLIYDPQMVSLSKYLNYRDELLSNRENIIARTKQVFESNEDFSNGRNTSQSNVKNRILVFDTIFKEFVDA